ncbi:hypothetical protein BDD12DRAFT_801338 [Trichophaea hybrida]|nr:hypothetical protein BDD12DRAFT_801338 [Trichophaea hybrida]
MSTSQSIIPAFPPPKLTQLLDSTEYELASITSSLPFLQKSRSEYILEIHTLATELSSLPHETTDYASISTHEQKVAEIHQISQKLLVILSELVSYTCLPNQIENIKTELASGPPYHELWDHRDKPKLWNDEELEEFLKVNELRFVHGMRENNQYRLLEVNEKKARGEEELYDEEGLPVFILPTNEHGERYEGAPNTWRKVVETTREQWEDIFEFYHLKLRESDPIENLRDQWCWFMGVPGPGRDVDIDEKSKDVTGDEKAKEDPEKVLEKLSLE